MHIEDADFVPVKDRKWGGTLIRIFIGIACLALIAALGLRMLGWQDNRQLEELVLVNAWNSVDSTGYSADLTDIGNDMKADKTCAEQLKSMMDDCASAGNQPLICSAYRSRETQQALYDDKIQRLVDEGVSAEEAPGLAATSVALPGTSEHELGLAFDIVDYNYQVLDEAQKDTPTAQWLTENCWRYGFILRYPDGKQDTTGITYEPWHFRYVGRAAAEQISQMGITLEEYVSMFYNEQATITYGD